MKEEQGQGRVGSRIRRDRWPPVDDRKWAQEGGHRGPDTRPGDDRRADREGGRRSREIDRGAIPSDACNAISRRAVCPSVRSCMPLTPLFLLPSFSHTKVNIPAIRMEYNAILSAYNRPGDALYRADLAHTSASILVEDTYTSVRCIQPDRSAASRKADVHSGQGAACILRATLESFMLPWV